MKFNPKSAIITAATCAFAGLALASCSDNGPSTLPHVFSGIEVPQEVLSQPRVVTEPAQKDLSSAPFPRLGDVPSKPETFSPQPVIDQAVSEMQYERAQSQRIMSAPTQNKTYPAARSVLTPPQLPTR